MSLIQKSRIHLRILLLFCLITQIYSSYYDEKNTYKILKEWNDNDPEYDPQEDDLEENSRKKFEERHKAGIQPKMISVHMTKGTEYKDTERISATWEIKLKNALLPVQRFIVNKSLVIFSMSETSNIKKVVEFFKSDTRCEHIIVDGNIQKCSLPQDL